MKKYALIFALIASPVHAENLAWMENEAGGKIILTNEACVIKGKAYSEARKIIAYSALVDNKGPNEGCWGIYKHDDSLIYALWPSVKQTKLYRFDDFTWTNSKGSF